MNYEIRILDLVNEDLFLIDDYLREHSEQAAANFAKALQEQLELIGTFPLIYPVYLWDEEYRRAVIGKYLAFYQVDEEMKIVSVHRVIHGSRNVARELKAMRERK